MCIIAFSVAELFGVYDRASLFHKGFHFFQEINIQLIRAAERQGQPMCEQRVFFQRLLKLLLPIATDTYPVLWGYFNKRRVQCIALQKLRCKIFSITYANHNTCFK